jgi:hypothetical protein
MYQDYAAADNCQPYKKCRFKKIQDKIQYYPRLIDNQCTDEEIDEDFFICTDRYFLCGYLPYAYSENSQIDKIDENSGVRIANGIDLGKLNITMIKTLNIPDNLRHKFEPFLTKKGSDAYYELINTNLEISEDEGKVLEILFKMEPYLMLQDEYNKHSKNDFKNIPIDIKTALVSLYREEAFIMNTTIWKSVMDNRWDLVFNYFDEKYKGETNDKLRRSLIFPYSNINSFSNLTSFNVFLIDISQIDSNDFNGIKLFLINFFRNYSHLYTDKHYSAILFKDKTFVTIDFNDSNITAINKASNLTFFDYTTENNFRNVSNGLIDAYSLIEQEIFIKRNISRLEYSINIIKNIFLIMSDSNIINDVSVSSEPDIINEIKNNGVNVVSIGLNHDTSSDKSSFRERLNNLTANVANILYNEKISYVRLECYEKKILLFNQLNHILLNSDHIYAKIYANINTTHYYKAKLNPQKNLVINAVFEELTLQNNILISVSYTDPFPSELNADYTHLGFKTVNDSNNKTVIIQGDISKLKRNNEVRSSLDDNVYIAIRLNQTEKNIKYILETSECNPIEVGCLPGTNELMKIHKNLKWLLIIIIILSIVILVLVLFYIRQRRKPLERKSISDVASNYYKISH